ncbi:uncharacterized protein LOC135830431 [Sycon ciliatum]|uniref:uncharacterized protein LOC135830431 n=1 Tax=Sycon ciliatum TaxID=27933 RepID=UPI0031F6874F
MNRKRIIQICIFFDSINIPLRTLIQKELENLKGVKVSLTLQVEMEKGDDITTTDTPYFRSGPMTVTTSHEIDNGIQTAHTQIHTNIDKWIQNGSNWHINHITRFNVDVAAYQPMRGKSYIDLPNELKKKKAIINVKNKDDKCLMWALLSALYPAKKNSDRVTQYTDYSNKLDLFGIDFPTPLSQISKVEKQNNLAINVFGYEDNVIYPLLLTKKRGEEVINLLLYQKEDQNHYCWIKDFSRLCYDQSKHKARKFFCTRCLQPHNTEKSLSNHQEYCDNVTGLSAHMVLPEPDEDGNPPTLKFINHHKMLQCSYVIYADTEALIKKIEGVKSQQTSRDSQHVPCGFGYVVVRSDGVMTSQCFYRGADAMDVFFDKLKDEEKKIQSALNNPAPMDLTKEQEELFRETEDCWICKKKLGEDRVRDHDHITGDFRGAAHNDCNIKLRIYPYKQHIPVVFHNLKGYDSHHLIGAIEKTDVETVTYTDKDGVCKSKTVGEISVIPNNMEKFISFTWRQFRFIDSCEFLNASLDRLVKTTPDESFTHTKTLPNHQLLMRKGVYPYEYMNSFSRFDETQLPAQSKFYSSLSDEGVSDDDYKHAETMWMKFDCQTLGDYHDLYLKTDVFLLADIFENFRVEAVRTYQLDPANYYTLPGFAWDALLMYSGVSLELLTDYDQHLFVESGMRGGVSMVSQRYAAANNHYQEKFDADQPSSFIQYLDANNLYGWAMSQHLPVSDFRWEKPSEKLLNKILNTQDDSSPGYIVECDLEYPHELHEKHNDYPVAPERLSVNEDMLSPYQQELVDKLNSSGVDALKLVPNLRDKTKYVLHYRNLKLYTQLGLRCVKLHRALKFTQTPWMRNYIEKNTDLRKKAKDDFSKDFYKLMNNAVFGKTMEIVRRRVNIKLLRSREEKKIKQLVAKPTYNRHVIFNDDLVGVQSNRTKVVLNKPIYVGMSILDLSKTLMYDFYYNHLKVMYGSDVRLLYTDTESLVLHFFTDDLFDDMSEFLEKYDTSNYDQSHPLYSEKNKKVVGLFKDELGGKLITEFVGLPSKMYSYSAQFVSTILAEQVAVLFQTRKTLSLLHRPIALISQSGVPAMAAVVAAPMRNE